MYEITTYQASTTVGVCVATLAISDAVGVYHGGAGCDIKLHELLKDHDMTGRVHQRVVCTKVRDEELILDPGEFLAEKSADIFRRVRGKLIIVTATSFVEVAGIDHAHVANDLSSRVDAPVIYVVAPEFSGDLFEGYSKTLGQLAETFVGLRQGANQPDDGKVNILGYFFDRPLYENYGNLTEMKRYLKAMGLETNVVMLGGGPADDFYRLGDASSSLVLPLGKEAGKVLGRLPGHSLMDVPLPMGLRGTRRFIEAIADHHGLGVKAGRLIEREEKRVRDLLRQHAESLVGLRVGVFADGAKLNGLLHMCRDLKLTPVLAGVLDGREELLEEHPWPDLEVMNYPGCNTTYRRLEASRVSNEIDLVIGTSTEVNQARAHGIGGVEFGFPCADYHPMFPAPYFGYSGVPVLGMRLMEAVGASRSRGH
jgi:nitrogenase molybdenum-iron protein alpha/beta subunit